MFFAAGAGGAVVAGLASGAAAAAAADDDDDADGGASVASVASVAASAASVEPPLASESALKLEPANCKLEPAEDAAAAYFEGASWNRFARNPFFFKFLFDSFSVLELSLAHPFVTRLSLVDWVGLMRFSFVHHDRFLYRSAFLE